MKLANIFFWTVTSSALVLAACSAGNNSQLPTDAEDASIEHDAGWDGEADAQDSDTLADASYDGAEVSDGLAGDADAPDGHDAGEPCSPQPPVDPQPATCQQWVCSEKPYPICWSCDHQPMDEGSACQEGNVAYGICRQGVCRQLPDPGQPGSHEVETLALKVPARVRPDSVEVPLDVFLPKGLQGAAAVVLGHGFQLDAGYYASYGRHLASWGYVGVIVHYSGSAILPRSHRLLAVDLQAVLDWLTAQAEPGGQLAGRLDPARILLAGHSMGGKIAMLVASADSRPWGVFGLDPVDAGGGPFGGNPTDYPSVTPERMGDIQAPLLILGELTNATCSGFGCQACAPEEDNFHQYYLYAVTPACEVELVGADHMDFIDNPDCGLVCSVCPEGPADHQVVKLWARRLLTAWLQWRLTGEMAWRAYLDGAAAAAAQTDGVLKFQCKNDF